VMTMSPKSYATQAANSVSQVLMSDNSAGRLRLRTASLTE
jgi:hypothetical protein